MTLEDCNNDNILEFSILFEDKDNSRRVYFNLLIVLE